MKADLFYSGPFYGPSDPEGRGADQSAYIIGLKRSLVRWTAGTGALKWQPGGAFNATYNRALEEDVARFKAHKGIDSPKWVWGQAAHNALETVIRGGGGPRPAEPKQLAVDRVAAGLFEDAYDAKHPGKRDLAKVRATMAGYLEDMERYSDRWWYQQRRPIGSLGVPPDRGGRDDCSALCVTAYYWARIKTGVPVPDPGGYGYSGYGNTVSIYYTNRARKLGYSITFEVGDVALYGPWASRHATICRKRGSFTTAVFTSHGSDVGPNGTTLGYRGLSDLFAVVRPTLVPLPLAA
jgi:hypothetical protein